MVGDQGIPGITWEFDGKDWMQIRSASTPPARRFHRIAYDSVRQRTILFGGFDIPDQFDLADTWEYGLDKLTLKANTPTISIANGGTQTLTINAGADLHKKFYWIFGSMTGTMPGVVLSGFHISLRLDPYTDLAINSISSPMFSNFIGIIGPTGTATASLRVPTMRQITPGFKLYHSYVVFDGTTGRVVTSSNPVSVEFK